MRNEELILIFTLLKILAFAQKIELGYTRSVAKHLSAQDMNNDSTQSVVSLYCTLHTVTNTICCD